MDDNRKKRGGKIARVTAAMLENPISYKFPCSKQELIQQAQRNNANQDILQEIENIPRDRFNSPIEVSKAYDKSN